MLAEELQDCVVLDGPLKNWGTGVGVVPEHTAVAPTPLVLVQSVHSPWTEGEKVYTAPLAPEHPVQ